MKLSVLSRPLIACLLGSLAAIAGCEADESPADKERPVDSEFIPRSGSSFQNPIEYVLAKLENYDLVMIGERHWTREEPVFIQNLIKRCYERESINFLFLECGNFEDQAKIDTFLAAIEYIPGPVIDVLRNSYEFGWGYQEYFDIFKTVYEENRKRPEAERIRIVLVGGPPSDIDIGSRLYPCLDGSSLSDTEKWQKVCWLRESIAGRDSFMAAVIATHLFDVNGRKGIYYAGGNHIRKDLREKDYGMRFFSTGGILSRQYPDRTCCLALHKYPKFWQTENDFNSAEQLFKRHRQPFAVDTNNRKISHLKLRADIVEEGIALKKAFDGYIMLNLDKDYHRGSFIPGFYDDEFAKVVWERLRDSGDLKRFPLELERFKTKAWTGEELMELMKAGVH